MAEITAEGRKVYTYDAPWPIYGMNWSVRPDQPFRLAVGSFLEDYNNKVEIIQLNEQTNKFDVKASFDHPYPTTKIMWIPDGDCTHPDLVGTTGDYMRLWEVTENGAKIKCLLNNNKNSEYCAPLTSFDWNEVDLSMLGSSSIDTTCTIWNIEVGICLLCFSNEFDCVSKETRSKDSVNCAR